MPRDGASAGLTGETVGHYRIESLIGKGGMGEVYLASDLRLRRKVAVKALPEQLAADANARARFVRECRLACRVVHPYVATVFDVIEHADRPLIVMEKIDGSRLDRWIRAKSPTAREIAAIGLEISEALVAIHRTGIVHRDLKPGNVMVTPEGHVKVTDFGVALPTPGLPDDVTTIPADEAEPVTRTGVGVGTVAYMSPEQIRGDPLDGRSDLFALGVVLYEAVTGEHPFRRETLLGTASAILHDAPSAGHEHPTLTGSGALRDVILRLLEKSRTMRYDSAEALAADLRAVVRGETIGPRPRAPFRWKRFTFAAALVAAVGAGLWFGGRVSEDPATGSGTSPRPLIAVLPLEDGTDEPDGRSRAAMVADLLGRTLSRTRRLRAVDPDRLADVLGGLTVSTGARDRVAKSLSVAWVTSGRLYREDDRWLAALDIFRPGGTEAEESIRVEASKASTLADLAAARILAALFPEAAEGNGLDRVAGWSSDDDEAQLAFHEALAARRELRLAEAMLLLERAVELDPGFILARIEWAAVLDTAGYQGRARRIAAEALRDVSRRVEVGGERLGLLAAAMDARAREDIGVEVRARRGYAERVPDDPSAQLALADAERRRGRWEEARQALDRAEALDPEDPRLALARAKLETSKGDLSVAKDLAERATRGFLQLESRVGSAIAVRLQGEIAFRDGRYEEAERLYRAAVSTCADGGLPELSRAFGTGIADCKLARGSLREAEKAYRESIAAARQLGDLRTVVTSLGNLGGALYSAGQYESAETVLREAIAEGRSMENPGLSLGAMINFASLLSSRGRTSEAKMISEEALQIARDSRDTRRESLALLFLADAEFQQGAFRESDAHYAELVATHRRRNAPPRDLGHALFSHAWILSALGRTREAKAAIDEALDIHRTLGERVTVAYALLVRAEVYCQWGDWESALRDLAEARSIGEAVDLPADDLTAHANLVEARLELARGRFDRASRILEDLRSSSSQTPATQVVAGSLAASCEAMLGLRQASTAGSLAHRAIDTPTAMEIDRIRAAVCLSEAQRRMGAGDLEDRVRALLDSRQLDQIPWLLARTAATAVQIPAFARERERVRDLGMEAMEAYWSLAPEDRRTAIRERPDVVTVLEILEREDE